jgi:hypothetical protein
VTKTEPTEVAPQKQPYARPKMVVLGQVRDLTLGGGSVAPDGKSGRAKGTM